MRFCCHKPVFGEPPSLDLDQQDVGRLSCGQDRYVDPVTSMSAFRVLGKLGVSLGHAPDGTRIRRTVRGRTKTQAKDRLQEVRDEIKAGVHTSPTYTIEDCVKDWLASLERDPHTMETITGQAQKWIYPRIGAKKLRRFKVDDADKFFRDIGPHPGRPGRPSRAMTEEQAGTVLKAARGRIDRYVRVVKASNGRYGATHAATESGTLACGTRPHPKAAITEVGRGLHSDGDANRRLAALFVLAITIGLRPGELRKLTWDLVDLNQGVVHVWRSASKSGDTKTPQSKRSLVLPRRAITALKAHQDMQAREREAAGKSWQGTNLVFCHEDGSMYTADALNCRFGKMTRKAGIRHWHAHEGRHTAVSIMSSNGVPIQEVSDTVGHKSTHVTETVYRHVIEPAIQGGATVMDSVFSDEDE